MTIFRVMKIFKNRGPGHPFPTQRNFLKSTDKFLCEIFSTKLHMCESDENSYVRDGEMQLRAETYSNNSDLNGCQT